MYKKVINGKEHYLYDNEEEFRLYNKNTETVENWREANEGDWCFSDDGKVTQILKKGELIKNDRKNKTPYIRTLLGTYISDDTSRMEGDPPKNIYSFSSGKDHRESARTRTKPTGHELVFARYVSQGVDPYESYMQAFPTNNYKYATYQANQLLRTERIQKLISKEIEESLSETGISRDYLLLKMKEIIDEEDVKDSDKIRAIELLMKITNMFPSSERKSETLTVFQGFSPEQLEALRHGRNEMIGEMKVEKENGEIVQASIEKPEES